MKKVILEIDDNYADALSITCIGRCNGVLNISIKGIEVIDNMLVLIGEDGKAKAKIYKDEE